jgi:hypothetical protein
MIVANLTMDEYVCDEYLVAICDEINQDTALEIYL